MRTIAYLHEVWERIEGNRLVQPDPFYPRNAVLTPEVVAGVINYMEGMFAAELVKYRNYHNGQHNLQTGERLTTPGFDKLSAAQQLAVVQGIDRIFQEYREPD